MMEKIETFGYSPFHVANWFIFHIDRDAGDSITHLKLQKLIYYAQAWSIVLKKKSLFEDEFEAWAHGPVVPSVYHEYKAYGYESLPGCDYEEVITGDAEEVLAEVNRVYGEKSAKYLEELTHNEDPWMIARAGLAPEVMSSNVITKQTMLDYYQSVLQDG